MVKTARPRREHHDAVRSVEPQQPQSIPNQIGRSFCFTSSSAAMSSEKPTLPPSGAQKAKKGGGLKKGLQKRLVEERDEDEKDEIEASIMNNTTKLLLLSSLLAQDRIITNNTKAFLKDLILTRNETLLDLLQHFEVTDARDKTFIHALHRLIGEKQEAVFNTLFSECTLEDGKMLSKSERQDYNLNENKSLIYGEVEFRSFHRILRKINPATGGIFYDLGSGTSRAVFVARLTQDFAKCIGIEVLKALHGAAEIIVQKYYQSVRDCLDSCQPQDVEVKLGSFLEVDWSDGDVIFANSTCFDQELMDRIAKKATSLKPGAYFITFTKGLEGGIVTTTREENKRHFEILEKKRYKMSWGPATVYIQRRKNADGTPFRDGKDALAQGLSSFIDDEEDDYEEEEEQEEEDEEDEASDVDLDDMYGSEEDEEEELENGEEEEGAKTDVKMKNHPDIFSTLKSTHTQNEGELATISSSSISKVRAD